MSISLFRGTLFPKLANPAPKNQTFGVSGFEERERVQSAAVNLSPLRKSRNELKSPAQNRRPWAKPHKPAFPQPATRNAEPVTAPDHL